MANFINIPSPAQSSMHRPCGHWHKRIIDFGNASEVACNCNCWVSACNVYGNDVVWAISGVFYPNEFYLFQYNVASRAWSWPYVGEKEFYTASWRSGSVIENVDMGWFGYGGDSSGTVFNFAVSNHRARAIFFNYSNGDKTDVSFTDARPQNCEGKIAIKRGSPTRIILLVETNTLLRAYVSTDFGRTYIVGEEWAYTGGYKYARIVVTELGVFYTAIMYADLDVIRIYRSIDGLVWTLQGSQSIPTSTTQFNFSYDQGVLGLQVESNFYWSINNGVNFNLRTGFDSTNYFAFDGGTKDLLLLHEGNNELTEDFTVSPLNLVSVGPIPEVDFKAMNNTTVRNSGQNVVYTREALSMDERLVLPVSITLGRTWDIVRTPLSYFATNEDRLRGADDPHWKFSTSQEFYAIDPDYK